MYGFLCKLVKKSKKKIKKKDKQQCGIIIEKLNKNNEIVEEFNSIIELSKKILISNEILKIQLKKGDYKLNNYTYRIKKNAHNIKALLKDKNLTNKQQNKLKIKINGTKITQIELKNNKIIKTFNSKKECFNYLQICSKTLNKYLKKDGFYIKDGYKYIN